jgi:hypothetical protein
VLTWYIWHDVVGVRHVYVYGFESRCLLDVLWITLPWQSIYGHIFEQVLWLVHVCKWNEIRHNDVRIEYKWQHVSPDQILDDVNDDGWKLACDWHGRVGDECYGVSLCHGCWLAMFWSPSKKHESNWRHVDDEIVFVPVPQQFEKIQTVDVQRDLEKQLQCKSLNWRPNHVFDAGCWLLGEIKTHGWHIEQQQSNAPPS